MSRSVLANAADDLPLAHVCVHNTVSSATNKFTSEKCYFYNVIIMYSGTLLGKSET